ncbi:hypothetical protein VNO78_22519 [Psophocarpus tetragonolobus]|uniref:Uncharacterized protein n=1 Tax=Psophocarpus tetragonolobus TaxID=3891 RepID=A0AAN9S4U0_PSOTE
MPGPSITDKGLQHVSSVIMPIRIDEETPTILIRGVPVLERHWDMTHYLTTTILVLQRCRMMGRQRSLREFGKLEWHHALRCGLRRWHRLCHCGLRVHFQLLRIVPWVLDGFCFAYAF